MVDITYEDLKNCAALAKEAEDRRERMVRLRAMAERSTMELRHDRVQSSPKSNDKMGDWISKLDEAEKACGEFYEAVMDHLFEVDVAISDVPDSTQRMILRLRYLDGLLWEEISDRTHYNERWCKELHRRGLVAMGVYRKQDSTKKHAAM